MGVKSRPAVVIAAVAVVLAAWLGLAGALVAPFERRGDVESTAHASAPALPAGWQRSPARLVPRLLMPRERISVGTFPMTVGGGGNCGREPIASIRRMRPGDALVSIQEYVVTRKLRRHLHRAFPARPAVRLEGLRGGLETLPGRPVYRATIPFSEQGRAFDALVYSAGRPSRLLRDQIDSLLAGLPLPR
jgi:hypothetical protein